MNKKVIGVTVGTPYNPSKIKDKLRSDIEDLKEGLTIKTLVPMEGESCDFGYGLAFNNLEVGKEYKAVCENPRLPDMGFALYASPAESNSSYALWYPAVAEPRIFTFKVLGMENSVVSFEVNGELKTRDLSNDENAPLNTIESIALWGWQGELYEVSSEAFDPSAMQQKIEEVHETLKADVEALQETLNSLERAEDWVL